MDNILHFPNPSTHPDVIHALERWLDLARSGEITSLVMVGYGRNDTSKIYHSLCRCWTDQAKLVGLLEKTKDLILG